MLGRLVIKNFKSIGEPGVDLTLKPLTILVGPNGSGKSSILEALALLAQSVGGEFSLSRELVRFQSWDDILHRGEVGRWLTVEVHTSPKRVGYRYRFRLATREANETIILNNKPVLTHKLVGDHPSNFKNTLELPEGIAQEGQDANFIPVLDPKTFDQPRWSAKWPALSQAQSAMRELLDELRGRVFFLSALRGAVQYVSQAKPDLKSVGIHGEDLPALLGIIWGSRKHKEKQEKIVSWSREFGMAEITAGIQEALGIGADFLDPELQIPVKLPLASHGARQVLCLIADLFWVPSGSIILVEEPEISLHPEAQVKLCELFADAIKEGKQIMISTHSHFLLLALGQVVQKGLLQTADIAVRHVTKDKDGTKAKEVKLSKRGYPLGWPASFERVEKELAREWAKSLSE